MLKIAIELQTKNIHQHLSGFEEEFPLTRAQTEDDWGTLSLQLRF